MTYMGREDRDATTQQGTSPYFMEVSPPQQSETLPIAISISDEKASRLLKSFLQKSPNTLAAYKADLDDFRQWLKVPSIEEATKALLSRGLGEANALVGDYLHHLDEKGLAPSSINRKLSSLKSLIKMGNTLGIITWRLSISGVKSERYKDVSGPSVSGIRSLLDALPGNKPVYVRNRAIIRCMFDLGLRRNEVCSLNIEDFDLEGCRLAVLGKGKKERLWLMLPQATISALQDWIKIRGTDPGALFITFDRAKQGDGRLTGIGLYKLMLRLGQKAGLTKKLTPHKIRHSSITTAIQESQKNGMGLETVKSHSRHADIRTVMIYADHLNKHQGRIASLVSETV